MAQRSDAGHHRAQTQTTALFHSDGHVAWCSRATCCGGVRDSSHAAAQGYRRAGTPRADADILVGASPEGRGSSPAASRTMPRTKNRSSNRSAPGSQPSTSRSNGGRSRKSSTNQLKIDAITNLTDGARFDQFIKDFADTARYADGARPKGRTESPWSCAPPGIRGGRRRARRATANGERITIVQTAPSTWPSPRSADG